MPFHLVARGLRKISRGFQRLSNLIDPPAPLQTPDPRQLAHQTRLNNWYAVDGDQTLRLESLNLTPDSVVFDLGGYDASFTVEVFARFACHVYLFEPCRSFFVPIQRRLQQNPRIKLFPFGLAGSTRTESISLNAAGTSMFRPGEQTECIDLVKIEEFLAREPVPEIHMMKVNIEGGEYELLEHLIETGLIHRIRDLQVQFHEDVFPDAERRMRSIQAELSRSHQLVWQHEWIWEHWRRVD